MRKMFVLPARLRTISRLMIIGLAIWCVVALATGCKTSAQEPAVLDANQTPMGSQTTTPATTPTPTLTPWPDRDPAKLVAGKRWTGPKAMPILMYHHISSAPPESDLEARLTVTDPDFLRQLAYLRCAGYYSISISQFFDAMYNGAALPEKSVILTFDDGHLDAYTDAFPMLKAAGFTGSFAIVTGWIGQPNVVTWDQLKEMSAAGMEIASHSVSHPDLGKASDDTVRDQLSRSKHDLEEKLGLTVSFFVYPSGEPFRSGTAQRQAQVAQMVHDAGYKGALTTKWQLMQDPATPYALNRIRVSGGVDITRFAGSLGAVVSGC